MPRFDPFSRDNVFKIITITETRGPLIISGISAVIAFVWAKDRILPETLGSLLNATIGLSAIAVGFLATAKSILLSLNEKWVVQQLKSSGCYLDLMKYFMSAIHWSFTLAVFSALGLLFDLKNNTNPYPYLFSIWIFVLVATGTCSYRVIHLFARILRSAD